MFWAIEKAAGEISRFPLNYIVKAIGFWSNLQEVLADASIYL
jgi:hypothetical protein